jgi:hypothetical protein
MASLRVVERSGAAPMAALSMAAQDGPVSGSSRGRDAWVASLQTAAVAFVAWMRDHGFDGDWHTAEDMHEFYLWHCAEEGLDAHDPRRVLHETLGLPGVSGDRRRINTPQFERLRGYLARIGRAPQTARLHVYRIASVGELADTDGVARTLARAA